MEQNHSVGHQLLHSSVTFLPQQQAEQTVQTQRKVSSVWFLGRIHSLLAVSVTCSETLFSPPLNISWQRWSLFSSSGMFCIHVPRCVCLCGSAAGASSVVVGHPLDTVKVFSPIHVVTRPHLLFCTQTTKITKKELEMLASRISWRFCTNQEFCCCPDVWLSLRRGSRREEATETRCTASSPSTERKR